MPRTPKDGKGDTRESQRGVRKTRVEGKELTRLPQEAPQETPIEAVIHWSDTMLWFAYRHSGWLRMCPDRDTEQVHLKWKFNRGKWSNHYVYVRIETERLLEGLDLLQNKVLAVESGLLTPANDSFYSWS